MKSSSETLQDGSEANSRNVPAKKPRRRWLRWLKWLAVFIVLWVTIIPSLQAFWLRQRVASAMRSAKAVRLEEYSGRILNKVELDLQQRKAVISALRLAPDIGMPGMIALCFMPHHRVVIQNADGREIAFDICFGCDEVRFDEEGIMMTPFAWQSSLRRLFTDHGIPIRSQREYARLRFANSEAKKPSEK
jgi:hypothetical protein